MIKCNQMPPLVPQKTHSKLLRKWVLMMLWDSPTTTCKLNLLSAFAGASGRVRAKTAVDCEQVGERGMGDGVQRGTITELRKRKCLRGQERDKWRKDGWFNHEGSIFTFYKGGMPREEVNWWLSDEIQLKRMGDVFFNKRMGEGVRKLTGQWRQEREDSLRFRLKCWIVLRQVHDSSSSIQWKWLLILTWL